MTRFGKESAKKGDELKASGLHPATAALLEDVMKKRGLSLRATQDVIHSVQEGDSAWVHRVSTGTAARQLPPSQAKPLVKVPKVGGAVHRPYIGPPSSFSGKRMACQIPAPERDMWVGGRPIVDRELVKDEAAALMELGAKGVRERKQQEAASQEAARQQEEAPPVDVREALVDQLVAEVQERTEFLESMQRAGRAKQYEAQIRAEISARMNRLREMGVNVSAGAPASGAAASARLPPWQMGEAGVRRRG